jgi:hypothetical protein
MRAVLFSIVSLLSLAAFGQEEKAVGNRVVAREDYEAASRHLPPKILERRFWNVLPYTPPSSPRAKAMEKHILNLSMVRDAARNYWIPDLRAAGGDPLAISGAALLQLDPDPRLPFVVYTSAGRPPFRCMDDFHVDKTFYEKWKREHPNFLGFWTGVEWDNEYITRAMLRCGTTTSTIRRR